MPTIFYSEGREFFSTTKIIKSERRTNVSCSTLNDLMEVSAEDPD